MRDFKLRRSRITILVGMICLGGINLTGTQLALHLTFDLSGNLPADSSGYGHVPGYTEGTPAFTSTAVAGGGAAYFDGLSYYRWGSAVAAGLAGSFSVSVWVNTTQTYGSNGDPAWAGAGIVYADQPGHAQDTVPLALTGNRAAFMTDNGSTDTTLHTTLAINPGSYIHLVSTYDIADGSMKLYHNGTLQGSATVASNPHNARGLFFLGANDFDSRYFVGMVDDLQFYTTALSASEVSYLHTHPGLAVIPEPGMSLLVAGGVGLMAGLVRRRKGITRQGGN